MNSTRITFSSALSIRGTSQVVVDWFCLHLDLSQIRERTTGRLFKNRSMFRNWGTSRTTRDQHEERSTSSAIGYARRSLGFFWVQVRAQKMARYAGLFFDFQHPQWRYARPKPLLYGLVRHTQRTSEWPNATTGFNSRLNCRIKVRFAHGR